MSEAKVQFKNPKSTKSGKRREGCGGGRAPCSVSETTSTDSGAASCVPKTPSAEFAAKTGAIPIRQVKYEPVDRAPRVTGVSRQLTGTVTFLIDTGAEINLIKANALRNTTGTDYTETVQLTGISSGKCVTLGTTVIRIFGVNIKFHLVTGDFPIESDGILGTEFLRSNSATIDYDSKTLKFGNKIIPFVKEENFCILPRTSRICYCYINNTMATEGYVPRLQLQPGVFAGEALVRNVGGRGYFKITNTTSESVCLAIPKVELLDYSIGTLPNSVPNTIDPSDFSHAIHTIFASKSDTQVKGDKNPNSVLPTAPSRAESVKTLLRLDHLNAEEEKSVLNLIAANADIFHLPGELLGSTNILQHKITTSDNVPVHTKQYRFPPIHKEEIKKQSSEMLRDGIIKPSISPYNSPIWIVPKKADSKGNPKWRMVIDYRNLNEKTVGDAYPLPNITEILDQLGAAKYFSIFDLKSGFHQIKMHPDDQEKTAFSTPYGHFEFCRMPFGLKNAPATFQRLMDHVLTGLQGEEMFVYLDDVVLYASSLSEHETKFNKLAHRLRKANLKLQPDKCEFLKREVIYLGHVIGEDGVKPDPGKLEAVREFPRPGNAKSVRQFLGLAGYYRRFIPAFSKLAKPLTDLLKKDASFCWGITQEGAFCSLRDALCREPILQYPNFSLPFNVTTDASGYAIGAVLSQGPIGRDLPVSYCSRILNQAERNYSTIERELLAIVYATNYFRPYLYGKEFILVTDHKPLVWLKSVKDPTSRLVKWSLKLAEYSFKIVYKSGAANANADALSRNPVETKNVFPIYAGDSDESPAQFCIRQRTPGDVNGVTNETADETSDLGQTTRDGGVGDCPVTPPATAGQETMNDGFTDDESSDYDRLYSPPTPTRQDSSLRMLTKNLGITRDPLELRHDNLVIFTDLSGSPCDEGAKILKRANRIPKLEELCLARARVLKLGKYKLIAIPIKERVENLTKFETLVEAVGSLLSVTRELSLTSVSIARTRCIDGIPWLRIQGKIANTFENENCIVTVCHNEVLIPEPEKRESILTEFHSSAIGGHKGVTKTYNRIRQKYHWPNMKRDVQNFIQNCKSCQLKKLVRIKSKEPMVLTDTPGAAFDKIAMDIVGPLPETASGNKYILTIQDVLTKFFIAVALRSATSADIAEAMVRNLCNIFGAPRSILTDQGTNFTGSLLKAIARQYGIKQIRTTAFHPQSNGSLERSHIVLIEYLKHFINNRSEWDELLSHAMFSYNTSTHEGTRFTPFELVFGKQANVPSSDVLDSVALEDTYLEYYLGLVNKIRSAQEIARRNLVGAKVRSKFYYDRNARGQRLEEGQSVYLLKQPTSKLGNQYTGPHQILEVLPKNNIRIGYKNKSRIVHKDKLKLVKSRN